MKKTTNVAAFDPSDPGCEVKPVYERIFAGLGAALTGHRMLDSEGRSTLGVARAQVKHLLASRAEAPNKGTSRWPGLTIERWQKANSFFFSLGQDRAFGPYPIPFTTLKLPEVKNADALLALDAEALLDYAERVAENEDFWSRVPKVVKNFGMEKPVARETLREELRALIEECK